MKFEEGKPELTLVYGSLLEAIAKVRRYGIEKHDNSEDWRSTESIRHYDAVLRHIFAHLQGAICDHESGYSHLWHAACNIMFEIERSARDKSPDILLRRRKGVLTSKDPIESTTETVKRLASERDSWRRVAERLEREKQQLIDDGK